MSTVSSKTSTSSVDCPCVAKYVVKNALETFRNSAISSESLPLLVTPVPGTDASNTVLPENTNFPDIFCMRAATVDVDRQKSEHYSADAFNLRVLPYSLVIIALMACYEPGVT